MAHFRKLPSQKWQAQVHHPSGRQITKSFTLKRDAVTWAADTESAIRRGDWIDPKLGKQTLADWYTLWSTTRRVEEASQFRDTSHWHTHVKPKWGTWPVGTITYMECAAWVADMKSAGTGGWTIVAAAQLLRGMLDAALRERIISSNPMRLVKVPAPPKHVDRIITPEEEEFLYARSDEKGWEDFTLFLRTLFGTGARFGEAAGMERHVVNPLLKKAILGEKVLRKRTLTLKEGAKSRAGTGRVVPLTKVLAKLLDEHIKGHTHDMVFVNRTGGKLNYDNIRDRKWKRLLWSDAKDGEEPVPLLAFPLPTLHDIRHTYGTRLAEAGVPPHEIKALMGHASLASTERYLHAGEERMQRARDALSARSPHAEDAEPEEEPGDEAVAQ